MEDLSEIVFQAASIIAENKENAIKDAISYAMGNDQWTEVQAAELVMTVDIEKIDGVIGFTETFYINLEPMVVFGPICSKTSVEGDGVVLCQFGQNIYRLF